MTSYVVEVLYCDESKGILLIDISCILNALNLQEHCAGFVFPLGWL